MLNLFSENLHFRKFYFGEKIKAGALLEYDFGKRQTNDATQYTLCCIAYSNYIGRHFSLVNPKIEIFFED